MKNVKYTRHLRFRLQLRKIPYELPLEVYKNADAYYFDYGTENHIAFKRVEYKGKLRDMIVVYKKQKGSCAIIITIHPLKEGQRDNRIRSGRWLKVEKA